jgi:HlyD family secretion protein/epimerase transport system membrane fusion protein
VNQESLIQKNEAIQPENDYRSNPRGPLLFGLALIFIAFGGFVVWAASAPLDSAVLASGVVVVESERKVVQHLEGGIVKKILVQDGDYVNKGDLLLRMDDTRARSLLEIVKGQLNAVLALEARLITERDDLEQIVFPAELLHEENEDIRQILEGQQQLFDARRQAIQGQFDILNQRIAQYREQIEGMKAQQISREEQIVLFEQELVGLEKLLGQGNIAENYVIEKKRQLARLKGEQGKFRADVALSKQGIGETKLQIKQIQKDLQEEVISQLRQTQDKIADLQERFVTASDVLDRIEILAPASGVVIGLNVHTVGGVIGPGVNILEIVPQDEELIFEARVQTTDIDDVELGQRATVRLSAFSFRNTLLIEGEVINASADSLTDPYTGASYYAVRIRVPHGELAKLGDARLYPGMPVETQIKTGKRTMLAYILTPVSDILARAFKEK